MYIYIYGLIAIYTIDLYGILHCTTSIYIYVNGLLVVGKPPSRINHELCHININQVNLWEFLWIMS